MSSDVIAELLKWHNVALVFNQQNPAVLANCSTLIRPRTCMFTVTSHELEASFQARPQQSQHSDWLWHRPKAFPMADSSSFVCNYQNASQLIKPSNAQRPDLELQHTKDDMMLAVTDVRALMAETPLEASPECSSAHQIIQHRVTCLQAAQERWSWAQKLPSSCFCR